MHTNESTETTLAGEHRLTGGALIEIFAMRSPLVIRGFDGCLAIRTIHGKYSASIRMPTLGCGLQQVADPRVEWLHLTRNRPQDSGIV